MQSPDGRRTHIKEQRPSEQNGAGEMLPVGYEAMWRMEQNIRWNLGISKSKSPALFDKLTFSVQHI